MVKLKTLLESYIRVEKSPTDLTIADGEAGRGIYFSLSKYPAMISHYKQSSGNDARVVKAHPKVGAVIVDLTGKNNLSLLYFMRKEIDRLATQIQGFIKPRITYSNYQRFGRLIQDFLRKYHPDVDAYIVNHEAKGTSLPKGKQMIVVDQNAFHYEEL